MPTTDTGQQCVRARTLPADLQSAAADPAAANPATADPTAADPTATDPATANPAATDAAATDGRGIRVIADFSIEKDILQHARRKIQSQRNVILVVCPHLHVCREVIALCRYASVISTTRTPEVSKTRQPCPDWISVTMDQKDYRRSYSIKAPATAESIYPR